MDQEVHDIIVSGYRNMKCSEKCDECDKCTNVSSFTKTQKLITKECAFVRDVLLQKNKEYGDSALKPLRIFASSDNVEQINTRIDDKLSRIANQGEKNIKEDTVLDLIGYLILKRIAEREVITSE